MATIFVNPRWNTNDNPITVYVSGDLVYNDSSHGGTEANCYSTFKKAYDDASSAATIYVYNAPNSPLSLAAPSGTYSQQLSSAFSIEKNLYVRAGIFQVGSVEHYTYSFNIIGAYTVDFGVTESFNIAQNTIFNVWNGANFQLGSTGSGTSVSLQNSGTVCVSNGATFQAGNTSITNNVEIEVTGSAFSVASVTNTGTGTGTGTFTVKGTSTLNIDTLDGAITLAVIPANDNNPAVNPTLNASSITGGGTNGGTLTAQGDLTFTGANTLNGNTLNGITLDATGKTVTVGDTASLTVKGTSTLNIGTLDGTITVGAGAILAASSITGGGTNGGTITADGALTFTEANTLNGITLDATGKTVTVGTDEGDSLTVGGTSTLNIGTLSGTILTDNSTTLMNSNITGGAITASGSVRVNNSTISSNVFTATESGVDFSGACILDGVNLDTGMLNDSHVFVSSDVGDTLTISGGTLRTEKLYGYGTVTVTGENELHIGNLYGDGIKLDDATIKDSSIVGGMSGNYGGTLLVEADKTATFSGTNTMSATSISNSGTITINVNGRLTTGAITNTNGTITLNGGATVSSAISGGSITTSNTGTVTVDNSTISSSAFTATADEVIFYYRNTLNGVTLDATGKTVTVNGTLTLTGANTLNATNITSGTISAQDNLTFTGTNTLNGVTLNATVTGKTVTVGTDEGDSLTVEGTNTLNIGTLNGTITTLFATTLNASSITGGGTNGGSISAQNDLTFTGANTLSGVTLDATDRTVTVDSGATLTVGGTSTLNIGTLNGEIKTDSAGTTLNASSITGGGTNGGTITALGDLTFANNTHLRNITLDALDQTVNAGSYNLRVGGTSTLKIGTLSGAIWLQNGATVSKSTISGGGGGGLFIYNDTPVIFAGENQVNAGWTYEGHYTSIANCGLITVKSIPASGDNPNALDYVPAQRGVLKAIDIWNKGSITVGSADAENADACSIEVTNLTNTNDNSSLTITCNAKSANPSRLKATQGIVNYGMMTLTNSELTANTLTNYGRGTFVPAPHLDQSKAAITISDSIVSITDSLTNGAANNTSATIEFNNSTVTADSVTNYGIDNGTGGNTGKTGFVVNDSTFTVNDTFTNLGKIDMTGVTLQAAAVVTSDSIFRVYGTSTLDIASLTGNIETANSGFLKDSRISGGPNGGSISVMGQGALTFTGANTMNSIMLDANNDTVTIGNSDSLTVKGTSSLRIASLDGTILTDSAAATTLNTSNITNGTITAQNDLTFNGANTLNSVTLNAAGQTVTNTGALTVGGTLSFNGDLNVAGNASLAVGDGAGMTVTGEISNSGSITVTGTGSLSVANIINSNDNSNDNNGTITVDALSTLKAETVSGGRVTVKRDSSQVLTEDVYHVVDANLQNVTVGFIGDLTDYTFCPSFVDSGLYLFKKDPSTVYVNGNYPAQPNTLTPDGHLVGVNAFTNNPDGTETSLHFSNNTEKIVYYANANAYAALNLAVDNAPANLTITTEAVGNNEVVTMGPLTVGSDTKNQTVTLSGAKMSLLDATEPAASSLSVSSGSTLNVGGESASGLTAQTVNNAGTINVTNSTFAASTVSIASYDSFFVAGESTLNIDSLTGAIKLNNGATVSNSTVYSDVNVGETTTSCSGRLVIATGSSVTFAGANTFRDTNNEKGIEIGNLGSVTVKSIAASGDDPAASDYVPAQRGVLKVFGFDNGDTLTVGSNSDACTFDVINLNNTHTLTVNGKTDDLSRLKASSVENYGTIELTNAIAEAGSLQNGNASNTTTTIGITNSEFTADSVTNYSSGISNVREGMTVINSTLFKANSLVNNGTIKFRGKNKLDIGSLSGTLYFDVAEGTQATLNDSSITDGTLQAVSVMKFTGANTLTNITVDAAYMGVTVGTDEGDSLTVSGINTLIIKELNGTITTANSATLQNSNITGGAITALGTIEVKDSTISSNTFTAKVYGVDFSGACILDGVNLDTGMWNDDSRVFVSNGDGDTLTISGGTLSTGKLYGYGTVTVTGENELHIRELYGDGIKLDDATIKDSSIVGGMSGNYGGTLVVESGKTATFSTTESNRNNNLANTSIINSGTSATSYGTITVNGKMSCGTVTNNAYAKIFISDADVTAGTVTNLAETGDSTGSQITVTDSSFTASTVSVNFYADFYVSGENTLDIGNLTGTIRLNDGATISNSAVYADINNSYSGKLNVGAYSSVIFAGSNTFLSNNKERGLYVEINGSATVQSTSNQKGELKGHHIQVGNLTVGSETDACIVDTISLSNGGTLTVNGKTDDRSSLHAISIDNYSSYGSMSLTNTVLETETLVNTCVGTVDNKPGITITDSEAFVGSLRNGNDSNRVATIKIERSEFTAGSIANYSTGPKNEHGQLIRPGIAVDNSTIHVGLYDNDHNVVAGTGDITNNAGAWIKVENSVFTALGTLTINAKADLNDGGISFTNSTVSLASIVNNGTPQTQAWQDDGRILFTNSTVSVASVTNRGTFRVIGTSKLDINALDGTIETSDLGATLNDSSITGGANGGTISAQNSLTFTGVNTLNGITLNAAGKTVTVGNSASLTVKGTSTLNIGNLNGTILTDTAAATTLTASSITNGTITAQNSLAFTGANTLNSVTLTATDKTVTVGTGATLTVGGTSTLNIGTLDGTITVADGATLSNSTVGGTITVDNNTTLKDTAVGGTVIVQSGATLTLDGTNSITTLDLSEATGVVMDWQDTLSFTGFGDPESYEGKLTINLNSFTAGDLSTPILHYAGDGEWNTEQAEALYRALLKNKTPWSSSEGAPIQYSFYVDENTCDLCINISQIVVKGDKTYDTISVLNGIDSIIEDGEFQRGVMAGNLVTEADAVNVGDISMTVNGGTYEKLLGGGDCVNPAESGGTTSAIRCAGFTGEGAEFTYAKTTINFTITGGVFEQHVAGGMEYMDTTPVSGTHDLGYSKLYGDINLNISGGEFQRYLYGGSVAANKSLSGCTEIVGDVTVTIDATDPGSGSKTIKLNKFICGSYNVGTITGSTKLVLTGNADNLQFFEGGEIWGGCGGDYYKTGTPGEREFQSNITGSRTLSFTGFSGTLNANCTRIRGFSDIEFLDNSIVTLARDDYSLSDVENWEFKYDAGNLTGSSLAGSFANNFTNDTLTLNLNGLNLSGLSAEEQAAWKWTVLENTSTAADAFKGFGGTGEDILQVFLKNGNDPVSMTWNGSCYTGGGYNLALDETKLVLTLA